MDRRPRETVESWLSEALAPTPLPPGVSSRELVRCAVTFDRPPRLPYALIEPVRSDFFELAALQRVIGTGRQRVRGEVYCDEWGVQRAAGPYSWDPVVAHPLADLTRLDRHRLPTAAALLQVEGLAPFVQRAREAGKYVVAADPVSLYERLESLLGFESLLTAPRREAGAFAALLDRLADLTVEAIDLVSRLPGVDAFMTWQDLASQTGPHVSLDTFRRSFKPSYARIAAAAHEKNLHFIWHICGAVADLIPELIDLGVDVLQLDQPRLVGHELLSTRFGGKVCFWNTIDAQWAVAGPRTAADLHAEAAAMIRPFAQLPGGLMLRHYPFPDDIGLTAEFHEETARAFAEIAGRRAAADMARGRSIPDRVTIELQPRGETITVERGTPLRFVLHEFGVEFPCGGHASCAGCKVRVTGGTPPADDDQAAVLTAAELADGWRLACRCQADRDLVLQVEQWETVILADQSALEFTPREGLGIAVDLGTTTIVAQLLDLGSARVLDVRSTVNPNTAWGSDVMSRVQAALDDGKRQQLVAELRRAVGSLVSNLADPAHTASRRVQSIVIAGNTVMHHLFCDLDPRPLSRAPFEPAQPEACRSRARELGWPLAGDTLVRFLPCLGGFVGSDILCGILATKMLEREQPILLIDLGTNGEIVVGNHERVLCASTAAGPAFEGGRIGMGMRASTGAISEVGLSGGRFRCQVIGNAAPRGICGSGLVDAVACGLDAGWIEASGRLANGAATLEIMPPVHLSQQDIRQLQLAKAAIAAGVRILSSRFGLAGAAEVPIFLAGAFGNYVKRASARRIGLVSAPDAWLHPAGNTSLMGAKLALFAEQDDDFAVLRSRIEHVPLASDPAFQEIFIRETAFPESNI